MMENKKSIIFVLTFLIFLASSPSVICFAAKIYEWNNINRPFIVEGGHKLRNGNMEIEVHISSDILEIIKKSKYVKFYIDFSGFTSRNDFDFRLAVNGKKVSLNVKNPMKIKTSQLQKGINSFYFYTACDICSRGQKFVDPKTTIKIKRMSFTGLPSKEEHSIKELLAKKNNDLQVELRKIIPRKNIAYSSTKPSNQSESNSINPMKDRKFKDAIAVIIGNQNYMHKDIPTVEFANHDASAIKQFLIKTLGYREGNIISENDTTKANLEKIFGTKDNHKGMLYNYIKPEKSDVFIYYSGHGSPDPVTNEAYLVPADCDPVMMALTAYPLNSLYGNLSKIEARSVTIVIDACFSGGTNTGRWLVHNASPALIHVNNPVSIQNNITIFTSAENNQVSSWYPEKQHSMFTYFFLRAIYGDADFNNDKNITFQEIYDFVADRAEGVPYYSRRLHGGRIQTPVMHAADKDAVFVSY